MNTKVKCYCGKFLDDPSHKDTHQDKFLTGKEMIALDSQWPKVIASKVRNSTEEPWSIMYTRRVGNTFHMIGIYKP